MPEFRFGALSIIAGLSLLLSACQPSRQAFQMDSDSRTPMFGLELTPKKSDSDVTGIANRGQSEETIHRAGRSGEAVGIEDEKDSSAWSKLWGQFSRPKRIPLPRTDGTTESPAGRSATDGYNADFMSSTR